MNEINSVKNSNCISPKNIIMKKVKNLKQSINNNQNRYNLFHSNLSKPKKSNNILVHKISNYNNNTKSKNNYQGKTAKASPINVHNKIIGYININKVNSSIPTMILNINNKKYHLELKKKNKSDSKSKTTSKSKSKSKSKSNKKKTKEQSRNLNKEFSKCSRFSKVNLPKKINYIHSISHIQNNIFRPKEFFDNHKVKINNIKKKMKKETTTNNISKTNNNNKNAQKNFINKNSYSNNNFNLVTAIRQNHNLKVMKLINNIITKKKLSNLKRTSNTAINSTKNSKEKKQIKSINNFIIKNNNQVIKNRRKYNNNINVVSKKLKNKTHFSGSNIIKNIAVPNNETNLHSLIYKYSIITNGNYKIKRYNNNNYYNPNYMDCIQSSINIKNKKNNFFNCDSNNYLSKSYGNTIIKIKSSQNSRVKTKTKTENKNKKNKKQANNLIGKYYENFSTNMTHKLFPITTTQTKYNINYKRNSDQKNNSITKTQNNVHNIGINFNVTENNKSQSQSKSKSRNKNKSNQKEFNNNISNIKYSKYKKQKNNKYFYRKNKFEKKNNINKINRRNEQRRNNINNFIFNIIHNKSNNQESISSDLQKINKQINLTSSLLQNDSKQNTKNYKDNKANKNNNYYNDFVINESMKESNSNTTYNNNLKEELSIILSHKDYNYYQEESKKLSDKIKLYGKEHNYLEYPKTDLSYYKIGRSIGHGAFGKVNLALHVLSGQIVSIKSFSKKKNIFSINKIKNEVKIMSKLRKHNNIVKLFELFETEDHYCLVMENVVGGNLLNAINKMNKIPENLAKIIFKQLIKTLQYIHSKGIAHRDIKPDNILLDLDNTIKICDFGVSKIFSEGQLIRDSCGTPAFVAPEILLDFPYDPFPTDIWSSGVVLYAMTTGFFPFRGVNETQLHESILTGIFPKPKDISNELIDLLSKILNVNPKKRISLKNILLHPWFINKNKKKSNNLNLFTKAEQIIYGKLKLDYRKINKNIQLENFTDKNIDSYYEEVNQNIQTISFVFTPYNTRREKDEDDDLYYDDVNIEDEIIKFMPKVQEISRLYEIHNNCDFDQGYIVGRKQMWKKKLMGSIDKSFDRKKNKNKNLKENKDKKDSTSKKDISYLNSNFLKTNSSINTDNFIIDEDAVRFVEDFGYKKEYIIKSLELNELNHASATYYLKLSLKNS